MDEQQHQQGAAARQREPETMHARAVEWMVRLNEAYPTRLWWCIGTSLLGSFQFGYQVGVLNTCVGYVAKSLDYDNETMLNSSVMVGAALGALTAGMFADALGPKRAQALNTINFLLGTYLSTSTVYGRWGFVAGRVIAGIGAGASSLYSPRYIAEISPQELRGRLVTQHQVFVNVGILIAYFMGLPYDYGLINITMMGKEVPWWRIMIMIAFIPTVMQLLGLMGCLESPVWLESWDKEIADECCILLWGSRAILFEAEANEGEENHLADSTAVLSGFPTLSQPLLLRASHSGAPATTTLATSSQWAQQHSQYPLPHHHHSYMAGHHSGGGFGAYGAGVVSISSGGAHTPLSLEGWFGMFQRQYSWMLALALGLPMLQQMSGIGSAVLFSSEVFQDAGLTSPVLGSIWMGTANLAFTVMTGALIDRVGRRPMLIASYSGMAACLLMVSLLDSLFKADSSAPVTPTQENVGLATSALLIMYVLFFALGAGPVTWLYLSEILPPVIKGKAAALSTFLCWTCNLAVVLTFRPMLQKLGVGGAYLIYGSVNVLAFVWLHFNLVETKALSLREIEGLLLLSPKPFTGYKPMTEADEQYDYSSGTAEGGYGQVGGAVVNQDALAIPIQGVPVYRSIYDAPPQSSLPE